MNPYWRLYRTNNKSGWERHYGFFLLLENRLSHRNCAIPMLTHLPLIWRKLDVPFLKYRRETVHLNKFYENGWGQKCPNSLIISIRFNISSSRNASSLNELQSCSCIIWFWHFHTRFPTRSFLKLRSRFFVESLAGWKKIATGWNWLLSVTFWATKLFFRFTRPFFQFSPL